LELVLHFFYMMVLGVFYGMATGNPDPVAAMMDVAPSVLIGVLMMLFVLGAQISSNLTLNILPPAHTLQDISDKISWKKAVLITSVISLATCPWILFTSEHYFTFMGVYACLLGPILGITLADYWVVNRQKLMWMRCTTPKRAANTGTRVVFPLQQSLRWSAVRGLPSQS